jgi:lysozyme family protein
MANFDDAFDQLMINEGGYSNNPDDPGGATRFGITEHIARANGYKGEIKDVPLILAKGIAKKSYWDVAMCDQLEPRIAFQVFDTIYNGGEAVKWLQQSCNIKADGIIGAETIKASRQNDPLKVIMRFNAYRIQYLTGLKIWPKFGKGWMNRIMNNLNYGAK